MEVTGVELRKLLAYVHVIIERDKIGFGHLRHINGVTQHDINHDIHSIAVGRFIHLLEVVLTSQRTGDHRKIDGLISSPPLPHFLIGLLRG